MHFQPTFPPIPSTIRGVTVLNASGGYVISQNSQQARSLSIADKWVAAEHDKMQSITDKCDWLDSPLFQLRAVVVITTMFVYALKWTLVNTTEARWVVRGFL